jgi:hypothetical protein
VALPPLRRIIYRSRATAGFDLGAMLAMLVCARERNAMRRVTGLLLHEHGHFLQVLEGPQEEVDDLWNVIQRDPRHDDVALVCQVDGVQRWFGDWTMGLVDADRLPLRFAGVSAAALAMPLGDVSDADEAIAVIRPFADFGV